MTEPELVEVVVRRLTAQPNSSQWAEKRLDIIAAIPSALHALSTRIYMDRDRASLLQQEYSVGLDGSGFGDLLAAIGTVTGLAGEILFDAIPHGTVRDADDNILSYYPHYSDFLRPGSTAFGRYALVNKQIRAHAKDVAVLNGQSITPPNGPLILTVNYTPANVPLVPEQLIDDLADGVVSIVNRPGAIVQEKPA